VPFSDPDDIGLLALIAGRMSLVPQPGWGRGAWAADSGISQCLQAAAGGLGTVWGCMASRETFRTSGRQDWAHHSEAISCLVKPIPRRQGQWFREAVTLNFRALANQLLAACYDCSR